MPLSLGRKLPTSYKISLTCYTPANARCRVQHTATKISTDVVETKRKQSWQTEYAAGLQLMRGHLANTSLWHLTSRRKCTDTFHARQPSEKRMGWRTLNDGRNRATRIERHNVASLFRAGTARQCFVSLPSSSRHLPLNHRSVICLLARARPLYTGWRVIVNTHVRSVKLHRYTERLSACKDDSPDKSARLFTGKTDLNSRTKQTTAHSIHIPP